MENVYRLVILSFRINNLDFVPAYARRIDQNVAMYTPSGVQMVDCEKCSVAGFPEEFEQRGYELVDATYQERFNSRGLPYFIVRFTFSHPDFVEVSEWFKNVREINRTGLRYFCKSAMWHAKVFNNPFFKEGKSIEGQRAISVVLDTRQPLEEFDGKPVNVWQKDESGVRVGLAPIPLMADRQLLFCGDGVYFGVNS